MCHVTYVEIREHCENSPDPPRESHRLKPGTQAWHQALSSPWQLASLGASSSHWTLQTFSCRFPSPTSSSARWQQPSSFSTTWGVSFGGALTNYCILCVCTLNIMFCFFRQFPYSYLLGSTLSDHLLSEKNISVRADIYSMPLASATRVCVNY